MKTFTVQIRRIILLSLFQTLVAAALFVRPGYTQILAGEFADAGYVLTDLGNITGVPANYGGLFIRPEEPNVLYIGGAANSSGAVVYQVPLMRDPVTNRITGYAGEATFFVNAPNIDGGLLFASNGTLLFSRYSMNNLGQILPDNTYVSTPLTPLGINSSVGSIGIVPETHPGAGNFIVASYNASRLYNVPYTIDPSGEFLLSDQTHEVLVSGTATGPEGIAYIPIGSAGFPQPSMVISAYSLGRAVVFEVDENGLPDVATARDMVTGLSGAEGAAIDPVTGDFLFSTFGGGNRVLQVSGFALPSANADLEDLFLSEGNLEPDFDSDVISYTAIVGNATEAVAVTAVTAHIGASISINGNPAASGVASDPIPLVVGANTITVTVTAENLINNKTYMIEVTRLALPDDPESISAAQTEICIGSSLTLTLEGADGTVYWFDGVCGDENEIGTGLSIVVSPEVTTTYFARNFNGFDFSAGCASFALTVSPLPVIMISGDLEFCEGGSTVLTASEGASYLWSTGEETQSITITEAGTFSITVTDINGCEGVAEATVTELPLPVVEITGELEFCAGGSTVLTATEGVSYLWSTGEETQSITVTEAGSYSVTVTDENGCEGFAEVMVVVHPLPDVAITGDLEFCEGGSTVLTATEGVSYLWSTGEETQSITLTEAGTYSVTVTDENGCQGVAEVVTSFLPVTVPFCPGDLSVLITDEPFALTGATPEGGEYSGNGVSGGIFNPSDADLGAHLITYTIEDICGPQSCEFTITVTDEPITCEDAVISNFPDADDVCEGEAYAIDFSEVVIENAVEEIWTVDPVTAGTIENNVFNLNIGFVGEVTITLLAVAEEPCADDQASLSFTVYPLPFVEISGELEFCAGGSTVLTATEGVSYLWSTGEETQSITVSEAGSYSVTVTDENGCEGYDEVMVEEHPLPQVIITPDGPLSFCEGGSVELTASEGSSYLWSTGETTQTITSTQNGIYSVTVADANGCEGSAEIEVEVNEPPVVACPGTVQLNIDDPLLLLDMASPAGGVYSGDGVIFDGSDFYFDPSLGAGTFEITYCYTDPITGCQNCCSFAIQVSPASSDGHLVCIPEGWSGISSYLQPDAPLADIFAPLVAENKVTIMLGESGFYWPSQNINTLNDWDVYKGYKIKMTETGCIEISGDMPADKTIAVKKGANFIPVLCDQPVAASSIFNQFGNDLLFAFDIYAQQIYWPMGGLFTLQTLEPGVGYLVSMLEAGSATFNCAAKSGVANHIKAQPPVYQNAPWSLNKSGTVHFISIAGSALADLQAGDFIGVFNADGTCAGFTQYQDGSDNLLLLAYGDDFTTAAKDGFTDEEAMTFKVFSSATGTEIPASVTFDASMPDAGFFTELGQSKIMSLKAATSVNELSQELKVNLYPNPAKDFVNIETNFEIANIKLINYMGQVVMERNLDQTGYRIDISGFNTGMYFVHIQSADGVVFTRRLTVK
jgi:hypothetical protein